jgi:cytochrome c peroxidase
VINTVFNLRNFWDGRANNMFNGVDPFGLRNEQAKVLKIENGVLRPVKLSLSYSALASLASGPPLSDNEMSCHGRVFAQLGRKLVDTPLLSDQTIAEDDSVLGPLARNRRSYGALIRQAFRPEYWQSATRVSSGPWKDVATMDLPPTRTIPGSPNDDVLRLDYSQTEANFSLFFGVAVQIYISTLVSDDTPFDRYAAGNRSALTRQQVRGLTLFRGKAQCIHCHAGAELTAASVRNVLEEGRLDSRAGVGGQTFRYDNGFFNTGVRPTADDPGVGACDPFGFPLAETRISQIGRTDLLGAGFDPKKEVPVPPGAPLAVDGAFKTPGLRNVEFTGPYFHNGGKSTLMQVIDFYNIGGDFGRDNQPITDPAVRPLGLSQSEKEDLVAFLLSLSDDRVRFRRAPFDHPSICTPHGHETGNGRILTDSSGAAIDRRQCFAAIGADGVRSKLDTFLSLDPFSR